MTQLLDYEDLKSRGIRYSRPHLWLLVKEGKFPKPVKLAPNARNRWLETEIEAFIQARLAERDGVAQPAS